MKKTFMVRRTRGPSWDPSRSLEEQSDWDGHAAFMNSLAAEGFIALGGTLEGTPDAMLIIEAEDPAEIEARLSADPWTGNGLLVSKECRPWRIRLGELGQRSKRAE